MRTQENIHAGTFNPEELILNGIERNGGWVNAHAHLDRAFSLTPANYHLSNRTLHQKWYLNDEMKRNSTVDDVYNRIVRGVDLMVQQGVQAVGTFIDVDCDIEDKAIKAADKVRGEYKGEIKLVFINQVLKGVLDDDAKRWFYEGSQFVDIIGGLPGKDKGREKDHIDTILQTAKDAGKMVHAHVDQLNIEAERETELLCDRTIALGMQGKVVAIHGISIAANPEDYRRDLYQKINDAQMTVISCPSAWIDSKRHEGMSVTHNAIVPVEEMMSEGIAVAIGTDNIRDIYKPFSNGDMRNELWMMLESCRYYDVDGLVDIATKNGLKALGLNGSVLAGK